jgi:phage head maturation protease
MGNVDSYGDIIHNGSFTKTFNERGNQIKLLDNHRTDSVLASLGLVKELREMKRTELPQEMISKYPDVTGGAWGKFQFFLDTPEGAGAFTRIKQNGVQSWSFGYDAVDKDFTKTKDGQPVRNLRGIKLYEISLCLFPANEGTTTLTAKAAPTEGKPYGVIPEGDEFCVYKLDGEGEPTGKPMGKHPTEAEARAQMRALYANEEDKAVDFQTILTYERVEQGLWDERWKIESALSQVIGKTLENEELDEAAKTDLITTSLAQFSQALLLWFNRALTAEIMKDEMYKSIKAGRVLSDRNAKRIKAAMAELHNCLMEAGLMEMPAEGTEHDKPTGPQKSAITLTPEIATGAGPNEDERTRYLKLIEIEQQKLELLEV